MNKEFIPYEEALALKELGFDEPCIACWNNRKSEDYYLYFGGIEYIEDGGYANPMRDTTISAPLYQQAFRWFREKYGFYSSIEVDQTMEPKFCYTLSRYKGNFQWDNILPAYSDLYYTYEEAELACLRKLIEIVKNK